MLKRCIVVTERHTAASTHKEVAATVSHTIGVDEVRAVRSCSGRDVTRVAAAGPRPIPVKAARQSVVLRLLLLRVCNNSVRRGHRQVITAITSGTLVVHVIGTGSVLQGEAQGSIVRHHVVVAVSAVAVKSAGHNLCLLVRRWWPRILEGGRILQ
jgi:hypothetical protein